MIEAGKIAATWPKDDYGWSIAPSGLSWIAEGARSSIGEGSSIGANASWALDLGFADGYRKSIANVKGVAYIGAGCRWFTLAEALRHWDNKPDRIETMCLMQSAIYLAGHHGLAFE